MAELPGVVTPAENAPVAQTVIAPELPTDQEIAKPVEGEESVKPKSYSEEEHRKGISERLSKERRRLERQVRAEVERDYLKQELERARQPATTDKPAGRPQSKDFDNVEDFVDAMTKYNLEQRDAGKAKAEQESGHKKEAETRTQERVRAMHEFVSNGTEKFSDFEDVVLAEGLPITDPMIAAAMESEHGAEALYHLGNNLEEAKRISKLPPTRQVVEIDKLISKLTAAPKPTQTSAPIVPNKGNSSGSKSMLDMNQEEFEKHRKARLARK